MVLYAGTTTWWFNNDRKSTSTVRYVTFAVDKWFTISTLELDDILIKTLHSSSLLETTTILTYNNISKQLSNRVNRVKIYSFEMTSILDL